jgi:thermostable 8-oxoguanine DNA glycosylase
MIFLIDPTDVTNFKRTDGELQLFFLFCQTVAGKTAKVQARFLNAFLLRGKGDTPFEIIQDMVDRGVLLDELKTSSLGQFNRLAAGFEQCLTLDLRNATLEQIMAVKGVGNKTARFFLLHSRPDQNIAVLDVHILKYLRSQGIDAPKQTPSGKKYLELETEFLGLAKKSKMSAADFDLMLWTQYSTKETV